ncbi:MAG: ABC-2 type transport system permease protein [Candidatus Azotimanducaceae bacterium]|jgi:ABC-2 type transport system permease protein
MNQLNQSQLMLKQLPVLLKREFWEHKVAFFYVPIIISLLSIGIVILSALSTPFVKMSIDYEDQSKGESSHTVIESSGDTTLSEFVGPQLLEFSQRSFTYREDIFEKFYTGSSFILITTLWFVVFFYLQGALYEDRKDRSILFWKSLPVSDGLTVASKLLTALIVVPLLYFVFIALTQVAFLVVASVVALTNGVEVWATLWAPAHLVSRWVSMLAFFLFTALWCLPFYTWILFVSSWVKSVPFAWILGIPLALVTLEAMLFSRSEYIRQFFAQHTVSFQELRRGFSGFSPSDVLSLEMLLALALGMVFIVLTIWKRGHANEV